MADDNSVPPTDPINAPSAESTPAPNASISDQDLVEKLVNERVENALKPIKEKLDGAYNARDAALKRISEIEQKEKEERLAKLKEEGKFKEAYEQQLAEERAHRSTLEKRNIELTRDIDVKSALSTIEFRNDKALEMAFSEIVGQLVQNEQGQWVHRSGIAIRDFVKAYSEMDTNSFLLKPKANSGGGSSVIASNPVSSSNNKSLFAMSQEEVLRLASEGKLPRR